MEILNKNRQLHVLQPCNSAPLRYCVPGNHVTAGTFMRIDNGMQFWQHGNLGVMLFHCKTFINFYHLVQNKSVSWWVDTRGTFLLLPQILVWLSTALLLDLSLPLFPSLLVGKNNSPSLLPAFLGCVASASVHSAPDINSFPSHQPSSWPTAHTCRGYSTSYFI